MLILSKTFILTVFLNNLTASELNNRFSHITFTNIVLATQWTQLIVSSALPKQT